MPARGDVFGRQDRSSSPSGKQLPGRPAPRPEKGPAPPRSLPLCHCLGLARGQETRRRLALRLSTGMPRASRIKDSNASLRSRPDTQGLAHLGFHNPRRRLPPTRGRRPAARVVMATVRGSCLMLKRGRSPASPSPLGRSRNPSWLRLRPPTPPSASAVAPPSPQSRALSTPRLSPSRGPRRRP